MAEASFACGRCGHKRYRHGAVGCWVCMSLPYNLSCDGFVDEAPPPEDALSGPIEVLTPWSSTEPVALLIAGRVVEPESTPIYDALSAGR